MCMSVPFATGVAKSSGSAQAQRDVREASSTGIAQHWNASKRATYGAVLLGAVATSLQMRTRGSAQARCAELIDRDQSQMDDRFRGTSRQVPIIGGRVCR